MPAPASAPPGFSPQLICVCDLHAEAERYVHALRAHGYVVNVVEQSALLTRAHEAMPALLVCDVDAPGALALIRQVRNLPDATGLEVLAVGSAGQTLTQHAEAVAMETSGQFPRPVDSAMLVLTVETLIGGPPSELGPSDPQPSLASQSMPPSVSEDQAPPAEHLKISAALEALLQQTEERVASSVRAEPEVDWGNDAVDPQVIPLEALELLSQPLPEAADPATQLAPLHSPRAANFSHFPRGSSAPPSSRANESSYPGALDSGEATPAQTRESGDTATDADKQEDELRQDAASAASKERATVPPPRRPSEHSQTDHRVPSKPPSSAPSPPTRRADSNEPPGSNRKGSVVPLSRRVRDGDAIFLVGNAVRKRFTGAITFESSRGVARIVLKDGDFVTVATAAAEDHLVTYLAHAGDLTTDEAAELIPRLAAFGRQSASALIARGKLRQSELWPTLRAHAEWLLARLLTLTDATVQPETDLPQHLKGEPTVFGGSTGAEVLIDVVRRVIEPHAALQLLGGERCVLSSEINRKFLVECALTAEESESLEMSLGVALGTAAERSTLKDLPTLLLALSALGVINAHRGMVSKTDERDSTTPLPVEHLDDAAVRERIASRKALVDEADYFTLLGVSPAATAYDIERAYSMLRQQFEPNRILTAKTADLSDTVTEITQVLDEAYAILVNDAQRQAYRKALMGR
ncbi:MAG TPA: hypothetical protein VL137_18610 [Polyangiaceae bacterium]|nr:hypothetical protein [Polyangiaceae bacterium]